MNGGSLTLALPDNLKAGDYLVRHEVCCSLSSTTVSVLTITYQIIALHLATSKGGAEFYPSCTQIRVGGSGTGVAKDTVSFPGAYSDNDPGIFDPTVRYLVLSIYV